MNLMKRSMQANMHLVQHTIHLTSALLPAVSFKCFATNSKIIRIPQTRAIMKEPKAKEPKLYLHIHLMPDNIEAEPLVSEL